MQLARMLLLTAAARSLACSDDSDCSYNGNCDDGMCSCLSQWTGPHCASLDLVPTDFAAGLHGSSKDRPDDNTTQPEHSYWGGSAVLGDDGKYHAWNSEITSGCGIWTWGSNSQIVYSVSDSPSGTYVRKAVVFPAFAHEPTVTRAPTGEYVMWFTSAAWGPDGRPPVHSHTQCNCSTLEQTKQCGWSDMTSDNPPAKPIGPISGGMPTFMSWATKPEGPWSEPVGLKIRGRGDSNLAMVIRNDGSAWGMGRIAMYSATNWRDNTTYVFNESTTGVVGEDPFVWIDESRSPPVYHMLRHCNTSEHTPSTHGQAFGTHSWSLDGGLNWHSYADEHAYPRYANFSDGSSVFYDLRERPHLIFDKDGTTPLALTNGAAPLATWNQRGMQAPCNMSSVGSDCRQYSYTLLMKLNQHKRKAKVETKLLV